jgi:small ligand-binding sensory domain FIST
VRKRTEAHTPVQQRRDVVGHRGPNPREFKSSRRAARQFANDRHGAEHFDRLSLGQVMGHECVGVPVPEAVLRLEQTHEFHVLEGAGSPKDLQPVLDGLAILLFDGRKVGGLALNLLGRCHGVSPGIACQWDFFSNLLRDERSRMVSTTAPVGPGSIG